MCEIWVSTYSKVQLSEDILCQGPLDLALKVEVRVGGYIYEFVVVTINETVLVNWLSCGLRSHPIATNRLKYISIKYSRSSYK